MDAVLDMLGGMRLSGAIFLEAELTAPWCLVSQIGPADCVPYTPEPRHIIAFHYVIDGGFLLSVEGEPPVEVRRGEIVVLPRNDRHVVGSSLGLRPVRGDELVRPGPPDGLARIVHGGGGERSHLVCGYLGTDMSRHALLAILPSVMRIAFADGAGGSWIDSSFRFAARDLAEGQLGSPLMLAKLAELLFIEAVRRHLAAMSGGDGSWAAGLRDPIVGRALGLIHARTSERWTTDRLAEEAGLSRSAFAERFTRLVGEPPIRYLARHRLTSASALLDETSDPVARIAYRVGYEFEAAFNRAFKREYGVPPASWRKRVRGTAGDA